MTTTGAEGTRVRLDTPLARRNPTVKLALVFAVSLAMLFVFDPVTPTVLYVLALGGLVVFERTPLHTLLLAHIPFAAFALGLLLVNALSRPGEVLWQMGILRVTAEGVSVGAALGMRTLLIGVLAIAFLTSTDGVALMTSLHHNARLSARLTYAILAGYRMLEEMPREWQTIRQAHAVRSRRSGDDLPRGARALARAAFTLLVISIRKGERMAVSLESRGLGLTPRSTWRPVHVHPADWAFAAVVLTVLVGVVYTSAALGLLEGWGALTS